VGQGTATLLTTVEQIDPIYVNFDQPAVEVEQLRRAQATGEIILVDHDKAVVQLTLPDGSPYGRAGTLDFRDVSVDPTTGAVALRGVIPNPDYQLLPGMYVNVRLAIGTAKRAFLVSQAALQRDPTGPYVLVVGPDDKVVQKRVATQDLAGLNWIVTDGLVDGDRIITSGIQDARPGASVNVRQDPAEAAGTAAPARAPTGGAPTPTPTAR
jgi:membrane fusion protein (multidrug efflux system)